MAHYSYLLLCCCIWFFSQVPIYAQQRCSADERLGEALENVHYLSERRAELDAQIVNWIATNTLEKRELITIPVVVHVVWHEFEENISDQQIYSQIDVLNRDFQALNTELASVPTRFKEHIAEVGFEFCLAQVDPRGNPTTGILRKPTGTPNIAANSTAIKHSERGGSDAWDTQQYLNLWVGKHGDGILGDATFPGTAPPDEEGVVIDYKAFGTTGVAADNQPFHLGRTLTHEIGHYFNLQHPWGSNEDNPDCSKDDQVEDTPIQAGSFANQCPQNEPYSCFSFDMPMNFMNYTNDACMSMFTKGQKQRMLATLHLQRPGLLNSNRCSPITSTTRIQSRNQLKITPNPATNHVHLSFQDQHLAELSVTIYNSIGQLIEQIAPNNAKIHQLDLSSLPSGIYLLQISYKQQEFTRKLFVIQ